jgi:RHS repeat-associated protein
VASKLDDFTYTSWGIPTHPFGSNNYLANFTGKSYDGTGFIYFNARYYDPSSGRFVSSDFRKQGASWYSYCGNNPINLVDFDGKFFKELFGIILNPIKVALSGGSFSSIMKSFALSFATFIVSFIVEAVIMVATEGMGAAPAEIASSTVAGAFSAAISGGSPDQIMQGAALGMIGGMIGATPLAPIAGLSQSVIGASMHGRISANAFGKMVADSMLSYIGSTVTGKVDDKIQADRLQREAGMFGAVNAALNLPTLTPYSGFPLRQPLSVEDRLAHPFYFGPSGGE